MLIIEDCIVDSREKSHVTLLEVFLLGFKEELNTTEKVFRIIGNSFILFFLLRRHLFEHLHGVKGFNVRTGLERFHQRRLSGSESEFFHFVLFLRFLEVKLGKGFIEIILVEFVFLEIGENGFFIFFIHYLQNVVICNV
jgi:hypothetical protein